MGRKYGKNILETKMTYVQAVQAAKVFSRALNESIIVYSYRGWFLTHYDYLTEPRYADACAERPCTRLLLILPTGKIVQ